MVSRPTARLCARRTAVAGFVVLCVVGTTFAAGSVAGASATGSGDSADVRSSPAFVVSLYANGSATVSVVYTFDLMTEAETAAFEQVRTDETVVAGYENRTTERLRQVADAAEAATGREMAVSGATATVDRGDSTGVAALSVTWTGLAAVDGDRLVLDEPFASGFEPDRPFVVVLPEGYALADATVAPNATGAGELRWAAGTDLTGFEAVFAQSGDATGTPTDNGADDGADGGESGDSDGDSRDGSNDDDSRDGTSGTDASGPGFGAAAAVVCLFAAALGRAGFRTR